MRTAITNAQAFLKVQERCGSFHQFLWAYVDDTPTPFQPFCRAFGRV
ncbi:DNA-3-methyladenine glycosylase I [Bittarella massiliensis (ex Durand et al. 2017)]|uniref:DNA-3-methyladenine glycosylase I n=1 Tax=Bittarella massiliensis (ex Durand et al. 2017) TaxID=1720313 RepID=A0AAW5KEC2_9FIRM|nr:DNA-3-methyladenine glycosylase I [Bittarella massiliensis (ex Durand et al. 2017)]MCQ4950838.1 DNA-3-methyladenine glycosylase I [Bittarella massiliensis (ex Durand et al. 2017)]